MNKRFAHTVLLGGMVFLFSCKDSPMKNHGPIVLGDSSTIVTEDDPQKLKDLVADLQPVIPPSENKDTAESKPVEPKPDTDKKTVATTTTTTTQAPPPPQDAPASGPGLNAAFKETTVLVANLNVKQAGKPNLQNANGAVYTLTSGNINGTTLHVTGNVTKVSQRYQSVAVLKMDNGTLPLESLSNTTDWAPVKGGNNTYRITGLDPASLEPADADAGDIKNAVAKAAQRHRMSKKRIQELQSSVRSVRNANQKPLSTALRSVMWKIDGKDTQGKPFSKQIRVDIPM